MNCILLGLSEKTKSFSNLVTRIAEFFLQSSKGSVKLTEQFWSYTKKKILGDVDCFGTCPLELGHRNCTVSVQAPWSRGSAESNSY